MIRFKTMKSYLHWSQTFFSLMYVFLTAFQKQSSMLGKIIEFYRMSREWAFWFFPHFPSTLLSSLYNPSPSIHLASFSARKFRLMSSLYKNTNIDYRCNTCVIQTQTWRTFWVLHCVSAATNFSNLCFLDLLDECVITICFLENEK